MLAKDLSTWPFNQKQALGIVAFANLTKGIKCAKTMPHIIVKLNSNSNAFKPLSQCAAFLYVTQISDLVTQITC